MSAYKVGLTGGLASGKSTVAGWLRDAGFLVVDADRLVAELYGPGQPGAQAVADVLGPDCLDEDGAVDHQRVAARVFADPRSRRRLEEAVHPLVRRRFGEVAAGARGVVVLEAALLAEAGHAADFDLVVTVEAPEETRLRRAVARGMPETAARARLAAQGEEAARRAAAGRVLDNGGDLDHLRRQVDALVAELRRYQKPQTEGG